MKTKADVATYSTRTFRTLDQRSRTYESIMQFFPGRLRHLSLPTKGAVDHTNGAGNCAKPESLRWLWV